MFHVDVEQDRVTFVSRDRPSSSFGEHASDDGQHFPDQILGIIFELMAGFVGMVAYRTTLAIGEFRWLECNVETVAGRHQTAIRQLVEHGGVGGHCETNTISTSLDIGMES